REHRTWGSGTSNCSGEHQMWAKHARTKGKPANPRSAAAWLSARERLDRHAPTGVSRGMRNLVAAVLFSVACSSAYADRVAVPAGPGPQIAIDVAPAKIRAPYDVQVIRENGETLPTYAARDRFYVQGSAGERYTIRISNPTAHRVEAVVSVDGLDAIDGEN